jgi:hypothetical protein
MLKLGKPSVQAAIPIDSRVATTLQYIRASMDAAASVAVPGSAGTGMGLVGVIATALTVSPALHPYWLSIWIASAVVAAALGATLLARQSSPRGLRLIGTPIRKLLLCLLPSLFAGGVITGALWSAGDLHAIPGTWLLLYGCALVSASVTTTRTIGVLGGAFALLGVLALVLPDSLQILMLGVGFGGLHLLFGFLIGRMGHGRQV